LQPFPIFHSNYWKNAQIHGLKNENVTWDSQKRTQKSPSSSPEFVMTISWVYADMTDLKGEKVDLEIKIKSKFKWKFNQESRNILPGIFSNFKQCRDIETFKWEID
jgi:hypothetical protein